MFLFIFLGGELYSRIYIPLTPLSFSRMYKRSYITDYIFLNYLNFFMAPKLLKYRITPPLGPLRVL
jgi:hypothetical protein